MQEDLDRERKAMMRMWAKREAQIRGVVEATAGMYGRPAGHHGATTAGDRGAGAGAAGGGLTSDI